MSTVAKKVLMGSGATAASAYEIEQSAIFNGDAGLYRDSAGGNRRTWTLSVWVKRNTLGGWQNIIGGAVNSPADYVYINADNQVAINGYQSGVPTNFYTETTRVLRDVGAWYHIVVNFDSTQGTAANRMKIWINGVQETSFDVLISPSLNFQTQFNENGTTQYIGRDYTTSSWMKGQLAEMHFLDGVTKSASNFGETNDDTGQWIPKEYGSGSYGTNGYYLKFASGAIGTDSSGNGNNHTVQSLANSDVVTDTPTNNFATWDSNIPTPYYVFAEGNLKVTVPNQWRNAIASMGVSTGKWYWEQIVSASSLQYCNPGFVTDKGLFDNWLAAGTYLGYKSWSWGYDGSNGKLWHNAAAGTQLTGAPTTEWKAGVALDLDSGKAWFSLNGTWMGTSANPSTGAGPAFTSLPSGSTYYPATTVYNLTSTVNFGQNGTFSGLATAQGNTDTNGIGDFFYAVPTGFKALCTANLPDPAIPLPSAHFNTVLYTGNAGTQSISGVGFQPDWVWAKNRSRAGSNGLFDAVRGAGKSLESDAASAERTQSDSITSFNSDGFSLGDNTEAGPDVNYVNNDNYVSWNWKANGSGSTDTSGDINAVVSANQTAGFSIVTWTGTGTSAPNANATVPHGLGVVPDFVWYKSRVGSSWENWIHSSILSGNKRLLLQSQALVSDINTNYLLGGEIATSTMISNNGHTTSQPVVAYCFASKPGFSKIGVYTGNGNASGPFVNCGFKPAWIMIKTAAGNSTHPDWLMWDITRHPSNVMDTVVWANHTYGDTTNGLYSIDFLSNGFKLRSTAAYTNNNAGTFLYMAFAESPFKTANAQ